MSSRKRDYYEILGVRRDADDAELKRAFRDLARKHHPDVNPENASSEELFKEANEAYAVLSSPKLRSRYDRYGHSGVSDGDTGASGFGSVIDAVDDLIGDILRRRRARKRGRDLRYTLEVTFEEAALGVSKTIHVPNSTQADLADDGPRKAFTVAVPPGTQSGTVKLLRGEGERGAAGGAPGDLHVHVRVREHALFSRDGVNVVCEVPVSFTQAALGSVVNVPTLDGTVRMRVPAGTQSDRVFRIRGRGIPKNANRDGPRGDQMVRVVVEVPSSLTDRQRALLEQFAAESGDVLAHPRRKSFLDRVKALF